MRRSGYTRSGSVRRTSKLNSVLTPCNIRRNAAAQLNVSVTGKFYEKARSRRTRTRAALEHSGNQESAIALGASGRTRTRGMDVPDARAPEKEPDKNAFARAAGRIKSRTIVASARSKSSKFTDFGALEKELEQKSFKRRIRISHAMKRQHQHEGNERFSNTSKHKTKTTLEREEDHQPEARTWLQHESRPNLTSESQARKQPAIANALQPKKKSGQDRGEERKRRFSNQSQKKSSPLLDSDSDSDFESQRKSKKKPRIVKKLGLRRVQQQSINESNDIWNAEPPPRKSQPQFSSDSESDSDSGSDSGSDSDSVLDPLAQAELRIKRKVQRKERNLDHIDHKQVEQKNSAKLKAEPLPAVVDLVSSASESESENCANDIILKLTQLLQDEAIARGADRNEMQVYARELFGLGLHSKEMILDSIDLDDRHKETNSSTDMTSDDVKEWKWMKPFHKKIFFNWVRSELKRSELKRFRSGTKIYKMFDDEEFKGKVVGYDFKRKFYKILYVDGDEEEMDHDDVKDHLKPRRRKKGRSLAAMKRDYEEY